MEASRVGRIAAGVACLAVALVGATVTAPASDAEGDGGTPPTFQEFERSTYVDVDGAYVVNGDEVEGTKA